MNREIYLSNEEWEKFKPFCQQLIPYETREKIDGTVVCFNEDSHSLATLAWLDGYRKSFPPVEGWGIASLRQQND